MPWFSNEKTLFTYIFTTIYFIAINFKENIIWIFASSNINENQEKCFSILISYTPVSIIFIFCLINALLERLKYNLTIKQGSSNKTWCPFCYYRHLMLASDIRNNQLCQGFKEKNNGSYSSNNDSIIYFTNITCKVSP